MCAPLTLVLIATALSAASGWPGLCLSRHSPWGQRIAAVLMVAAAALGLAGAVLALQADVPPSLTVTWPLAGRVTVTADALSAFFLVPIFLMGGLGAVYGLAYWRQADHVTNGRKLRLFWGLVVAGMALQVVAHHAMVFLFGWEIMALSAFFLIDTEDHLAEVRATGWLYLVATHVGTLTLFAMFSLMRRATGSFDLAPIGASQAGLGLLTAIFFLALLGFGLKAGLMPLHFWLPSAHANAPCHVSAIMSGVLIKMGIYGLVRITGLLPEPPLAWGGLLLILGGISGVLGVVFALAQHDLKRLLAYHSVENIGIIVMGMGLAMTGRSLGRPEWVCLGLAGCLLHVWNHALFKGLLFLSTGSIVHAVHTRVIDRLGGLAKPMPWTAGLFLVGAVAICGLPPLNGFVSELLIYLGLFRSVSLDGGRAGMAAAAGAPVLALIGALAIACFVKVYGTVFLGTARSADTCHAHEAPASMLAPMGVLAACCAAIGVLPFAVAPALDRAIGAWTPLAADRGMHVATLAPLSWITALAIALLALAGGLGLLLRRRMTHGPARPACTWDCGYARPTARIQYTASSFAQMLVDLFAWVVRPSRHGPALGNRLWAAPSRFEGHVGDPVLDRQIVPVAKSIRRWLGQSRELQQGLTQHYVLYILITVIALLVWAVPIKSLIVRVFSR